MDDESLRQFIDRAARLSEERSQRLSEEEIREVALEAGLSKEDLQEAARRGGAALERGRRFLDRRRFSDAIAELQEARALLPSELAPKVMLARAYAGRFLATGDKQARRRAGEIARRCIDIDPGNDEAYEVLDSISAPIPQGGSPSAKQGTRTSVAGLIVVAFFATLAFFALLVTGAGAYWLLAVEEEAYEPPSFEETEEELDRLDDIFANLEEDDGSEDPLGGTENRQGTHRLEVQNVDATELGLKLDVRSSTLDVYSDTNFYRLKAVIINDGDHEIEELRGKLEFFDEDGQLVASEGGQRLLDTHEPVLRPGDGHAVGVLARAEPEAQEVRLTFEFAESTPAARQYPASTPVEVEMGADQQQWSLAVAQREYSWREQAFSEGGFLRATFEVTNDGGPPIRLLKMQANLFDSAGDKIGQNDTYVVASGEPAMASGERRQFSVITSTPDDYDHYRLAVASVR